MSEKDSQDRTVLIVEDVEDAVLMQFTQPNLRHRRSYEVSTTTR